MSHRLKDNDKTTVKFSTRKDIIQVFRVKKGLRSLNPTELDFPEGTRMYINVSLCTFYCGLWNKCSKLKGMSKLHVFFLSNGAIKIKILENDRGRPITHTADFQTSTLITCTLFVGNGYFQSNFFNTF